MVDNFIMMKAYRAATHAARTMKIKTSSPHVIYCLFKENHLYTHNTIAGVAILQFLDKERFHRLEATLQNLNIYILSLES